MTKTLDPQVEARFDSTVIETWKLDLERLLWSYHENGKPDGKTGVIGNPKTIEEFVIKLMNEQYQVGKADEYRDFLEKLNKRASGLIRNIREQEGTPDCPDDGEMQAYITGVHDMIPMWLGDISAKPKESK